LGFVRVGITITVPQRIAHAVDEFSYLSVLLSLILGLAITQILKGFRGIVLARARVRIYWPTLAWALLLLVVDVQSWWAMFGLRHISDWTFAGFAIVLAQTIVLYLLAAIVFPDFFGEEVDLHEHYYGHTRWFFGLAVLTALVSLAKDLVLFGSLPTTPNLAFHLSFLVTCAIAAFTRREWYHKALPLVGIVTFGLYIVTLFARLQ
jgi:hypothetical protein